MQAPVTHVPRAPVLRRWLDDVPPLAVPSDPRPDVDPGDVVTSAELDDANLLLARKFRTGAAIWDRPRGYGGRSATRNLCAITSTVRDLLDGVDERLSPTAALYRHARSLGCRIAISLPPLMGRIRSAAGGVLP